MMNYAIQKVTELPTAPPPHFTVYILENDEYIICPIRNRTYKVNSKPEEKVRQWWIYRLREVYGYPFEQIGVEIPVRVGSSEAKKAADIVVYKDTTRNVPRIFIEVKKPNRKDGLEQLQVYMNATGCRIGLWSNGEPPHVYLLRVEPKEGDEEATWRELRNIPAVKEDLASVDTPITRKELEPVHDFLAILKECEDHVKAHEGTSVFEEIFKLIFAKLYDERRNLKNDDSPAQFRVGAFESAEDARQRIAGLFFQAKQQWSGVFDENEVLELSDESLAFCVSTIQKIYLLKSEADVLGAAFEVMINPGMKGDKGQYFTPRHVIKMCVDILDPQETESVFDPACGSGGFLIGAMDHNFKRIAAERDDTSEILENQKDYASAHVYGMDFDKLIAKVAKAYMLIWGDGRSNIAVGDGLNPNSWTEDVQAIFTERKDHKKSLKQFNVILTNPPFAGDISADDTLSQYELAYKTGKNGQRKRINKMPRDKLFIERCLKSLKPYGRMAIVLPRGILKNYGDEAVRQLILREARVVAAVSLSGDMFKPFTNTKTCVLFIQKRAKSLSDLSKINDPDIAYCVSTKPGKDKVGNLIVDANMKVISDLEQIAEYVKSNSTWEKEHK